MKRFLVASVISLLTVTSGGIFWAEKNFDNPTNQTQTPIGYWRVSDIKKLFDGQQKNSSSSAIKILLTAGVVGIDYTANGTFNMFMSGLSSFSTLSKVGSDEQMYFSHQGDLFDRWDDIYVGGSKALIVATNADSGKSEVYPVVVYTPDFDSGSGDLVFFVRRLRDDESAEKLINLYQPKFPLAILKYEESFNLVNVELWVEPFSTDNDQLGS
ncbi:MAG: hypothetical protein F2583_06695 [Actinobacteria bacterium]|uniref:Unannotated protein n=1 Tax=freshwater metagenome TaxID=449393 RepID=A0A6J6HGA7_9ZZZZ|nr:hypothetical protein [Actinomycetota bacterium]